MNVIQTQKKDTGGGTTIEYIFLERYPQTSALESTGQDLPTHG